MFITTAARILLLFSRNTIFMDLRQVTLAVLLSLHAAGALMSTWYGINQKPSQTTRALSRPPASPAAAVTRSTPTTTTTKTTTTTTTATTSTTTAAAATPRTATSPATTPTFTPTPPTHRTPPALAPTPTPEIRALGIRVLVLRIGGLGYMRFGCSLYGLGFRVLWCELPRSSALSS